MEKNQLKYNIGADVGATIVQDIVPNKLHKFFIYEAPYLNSDIPFSKAASHIIVSIKPIKEIDAIFSESSGAKLATTNNTSGIEQQLIKESRLQLYTNDFIEDNSKIYFFTYNEAFDKTKYEKGEQAVFFIDESIQLENGSPIPGATNAANAYELNCLNVRNLTANTPASSIYFYENADWSNPKIVAQHNKDVSGIDIYLNSTSLIHSIKGKGKVKASKIDVDFNVSGKMIPFKATPISTIENKLTILADWFDYDTCLPQYVIQQFVNGASLESLKTIKISKQGKIHSFLSTDEINLIKDVMTLSYAYAFNFNWTPSLRFTKAEAEADDAQKSGIKAGQIKPDITITSQKMSLYALAGKDPRKAIDGMFERYIREHPNANESNTYRAVKQLTAALSRYIFSSYSIGKGQNSFNEIYLPWYLQPRNTLSLTKDGDNYTLASNVYDAKSRWFTIENGEIKLKENIDISNLQLIQTDRKLTIPQVPEVISEIDKLPLPGDINTKSSRDLMYMWYLGIDSDLDMQKLFLNDPSISTNNNNVKKQISTDFFSFGKHLTESEINENIKTVAHLQFGTPKSNITVVDKGTITKAFKSISKTLTKAELDKWFSLGIKPDSQKLESNNVWTANVWNSEKTIREAVHAFFPHFDLATIENATGQIIIKTSHTHRPIDYHSGKIEFKVSHERIVNATVNIKGTITVIDIDRDTLFDKRSWKKFLGNNNLLKSSLTKFHLQDKYNEPIDKIDEVIITSVLNDNIKIKYNATTIELDSLNQFNETITTERIIFT